MFKILHLPTGEEILINAYYTKCIITEKDTSWESSHGLSAPGLGNSRGFKVALFESEKAAKSWLIDLIQRSSVRDFNMKLVHFDIIEVI